MQFISVRELRGQSGEIWSRLQSEGLMIVTSNGKPVALLSNINADNMEDQIKAWRMAQASMAVARIQADSVREGHDQLPDEEIDAEIAAVRMERR